MREALRGLTVRGRAFVAGGLTAIACAVLLGQPALTRVGVLAAALPLVTALVVGRSRYRLALARTVSPQVVGSGQPARVTLALSNEGRTPAGTLLLEDQLPYTLGTRPRFVLRGAGRGWSRQVEYQVRSDVRGRFDVGPMVARVSDPFGLVELGRTFRSTTSLVVTPRVVPLTAIPLGGGWAGAGDNRPRAYAVGSAEDVTVREYRRGDDLRRVHWRSTARTGELMVRREEQPWQSRATIVLDNRRHVHRGQGVANSIEAAVIIAGSIAAHLGEQGFTVRLVTTVGDGAAPAWHQREAAPSTGDLLETLAVVEALPRVQIDTRWVGESTHGGLVIAVLGQVDQGDVASLRRMQHHATSAMALVLDVDAWAGTPADGPAPGVAALGAHGWRGVSVGPRDRVDAVWQDLGRTVGTGGPRTSLHPGQVRA